MIHAVRRLADRTSPSGQALVFFVAALALTALVHGFTLRFGFDYDDYHLLRPYTLREVAGTFVGPWDPSGVEVAFYRPLTAAFYAARFWVFGIDAWRYHALSLLMFAGAAALFGVFASLVTERRSVGLLVAVVYVVHPAMPRSQVAWATNQMHLLASLVVGGALVWWAAQGRHGRSWAWAVAAAVVALLIKEDGIMLLPLIIALQVLWRGLVDRQSPWPPLRWVATAAVVLGAILVGRHAALKGLGGYGAPPGAERMWQNYQVGARIGFFVGRTDRWHLWPFAQKFTLAVLLAGLLGAVYRRHARLGFLLLAGGVGAALYNAPFVFVTKAEQYHLIASFSAVSMAAGIALAWLLLRYWWWRLAAGTVLVAGLVVLGAAARHRGELFTPYTAWTLGHDRIVTEWAEVPQEIRDWLAEGVREGRQPSVGPISNLPVVVFGASGFEPGPDGRRFRWLGGRTTILPSASVRTLDLPLMGPEGSGNAFQVVVEAGGARLAAVTLKANESTTIRVPLRARSSLFPLLRRVTVSVTDADRDAGHGAAPGVPAASRAVRLGEIRVFEAGR